MYISNTTNKIYSYILIKFRSAEVSVHEKIITAYFNSKIPVLQITIITYFRQYNSPLRNTCIQRFLYTNKMWLFKTLKNRVLTNGHHNLLVYSTNIIHDLVISEMPLKHDKDNYISINIINKTRGSQEPVIAHLAQRCSH